MLTRQNHEVHICDLTFLLQPHHHHHHHHDFLYLSFDFISLVLLLLTPSHFCLLQFTYVDPHIFSLLIYHYFSFLLYSSTPLPHFHCKVYDVCCKPLLFFPSTVSCTKTRPEHNCVNTLFCRPLLDLPDVVEGLGVHEIGLVSSFVPIVTVAVKRRLTLLHPSGNTCKWW